MTIPKIAALVQFQTTPFLIYAFVSLQTVAFYGNYSLITDKLKQLFDSFLGSTAAGIGNLIAEGNKEQIVKVYWEMMSLRFLIVGIATLSLYYLLPPFIGLWLGQEYVLSDNALILNLIIFSLGIIRGTTDQYINGYGLFYDIWAPAAESVIFIVVAFIGGTLWQLEGILLGSIVSLLVIVYGWKPYFLFKKGLKLPIRIYWQNVLKLIFTTFITFISFNSINRWTTMNQGMDNWENFITFAIYTVVSLSLIHFILLFIGTRSMRTLVQRLIHKSKKP